MNCHELDNMLHEFLDHELDPARHREVANHLASCHQCTLKIAAFEHGDKLVKAFPSVQPTPDFLRAVRRKITMAKEEDTERDIVPGRVAEPEPVFWETLNRILGGALWPKLAWGGGIAAALIVAVAVWVNVRSTDRASESFRVAKNEPQRLDVVVADHAGKLQDERRAVEAAPAEPQTRSREVMTYQLPTSEASRDKDLHLGATGGEADRMVAEKADKETADADRVTGTPVAESAKPAAEAAGIGSHRKKPTDLRPAEREEAAIAGTEAGGRSDAGRAGEDLKRSRVDTNVTVEATRGLQPMTTSGTYIARASGDTVALHDNTKTEARAKPFAEPSPAPAAPPPAIVAGTKPPPGRKENSALAKVDAPSVTNAAAGIQSGWLEIATQTFYLEVRRDSETSPFVRGYLDKNGRFRLVSKQVEGRVVELNASQAAQKGTYGWLGLATQRFVPARPGLRPSHPYIEGYQDADGEFHPTSRKIYQPGE